MMKRTAFVAIAAALTLTLSGCIPETDAPQAEQQQEEQQGQQRGRRAPPPARSADAQQITAAQWQQGATEAPKMKLTVVRSVDLPKDFAKLVTDDDPMVQRQLTSTVTMTQAQDGTLEILYVSPVSKRVIERAQLTPPKRYPWSYARIETGEKLAVVDARSGDNAKDADVPAPTDYGLAAKSQKGGYYYVEGGKLSKDSQGPDERQVLVSVIKGAASPLGSRTVWMVVGDQLVEAELGYTEEDD